MRRSVATIALLALLLVPVASFADDPQIQPPVGGTAAIQHHGSLSFLDLLLLAWSVLD